MAPTSRHEGQSSQEEPVVNNRNSLPPASLDRLDPDSILAHDADPDTLLGAETDSEAGTTAGDAEDEGQRDSNAADRMVTAAVVAESIPPAPATPKQSANKPASGARAEPATAAMMTPTQSTFAPKDKDATDGTATEGTDLAKLRAQLEDLTNQVTGLNGKLVNSFMRISDLEDDLSEAREKVMSGSTRVAELEKEREEHLAALNTGLLVEKAHVSSEMTRMMDRVIEETKQRGQAESEKAKIEGELDELSASLFNEANRMVAVERLARARAEEKSKSMEERLQDTEGIMLEQQKVLADLQQKIEAKDGGRQADSIPAVDGTINNNQAGDVASRQAVASSSRNGQQQYHNTIATALMLDIVPYQELRAFLDHLRKSRTQMATFYNYPYDPSRPGLYHRHTSSSGGAAALLPSASQPQTLSLQSAPTLPQGTGSVYQTSPFILSGLSRHKDYPTLPSNCEQLVHIPSQLSLPFIKRAQEEDSDPCLRLDFAPGLNWLTRRTANTAILEGNLVIEPVFPGGTVPDEDATRAQYAHLPPAGCAMCGMSVVNVPLPGGEEAIRTGTPDLRSVTTWAQSMAAATGSAAYSLREAASGGSSSTSPKAGGGGSSSDAAGLENKPPLKTRSSGLFSSLSSLRGKAGSPKPVSTAPSVSEAVPEGEAASSSSTAGPTAGQQSGYDATLGVLPVPTHIFRLSESATSRYLLCPHHCLVRLRAACAFWGYLRSIERAVVLEGKLAWDDLPASQQPLPPPHPSSAAAQRGGRKSTTGLNSAGTNTPVVMSRRGSAADTNTMATTSAMTRSGTAPADISSAAVKPSVVTDEPTAEYSVQEASIALSSAVAVPEDEIGAAADKDGDKDDFQDAESGQTTPAQQIEDKEASTANGSADSVPGGSRKLEPLDVAAANAGGLSAVASDMPSPHGDLPGSSSTEVGSTPTTPGGGGNATAPPALPPRSRQRRAIPAVPGTAESSTAEATASSAPGLPPRATGNGTSSAGGAPPSISVHPPGIGGAAAAAASTSNAAAVLPPQRRTLRFTTGSNGEVEGVVAAATGSRDPSASGQADVLPGDVAATTAASTSGANTDASAAAPLTWEEKVYLEVMRLKRDMWEARAGFEHRTFSASPPPPPPLPSKTEETKTIVGGNDATATAADGGLTPASSADAPSSSSAAAAGGSDATAGEASTSTDETKVEGETEEDVATLKEPTE